VETSFGLQRRLLLGSAALSLAIGIWGMHFVGMLAAQLPTAVDYVVLPTLVSLFILRAGRWIRDFHRECATKNG
jgi:NO-binding membrane sensor protein with MHYT domain